MGKRREATMTTVSNLNEINQRKVPIEIRVDKAGRMKIRNEVAQKPNLFSIKIKFLKWTTKMISSYKRYRRRKRRKKTSQT